MAASTLGRPSNRPAAPFPHLKAASGAPDAAYEALTHLTRLRDRLAAVSLPRPSRWKVPPLFFFDAEREAQRLANTCSSTADPLSEVATLIAEELPLLYRSVQRRRTARAIEGLRTVVEALARHSLAANDLTELLAMPDDEVILVLHPETRTGFRLSVCGVADVGQFHVLAIDALSDLNPGLCGPAIPGRFVAACRNAGGSMPAGIPMVMEARFQLYTASGLQSNGTLPAGFGGCEHWLWPTTPLAAIPRLGGERVVLLGPTAYSARWDVELRFPAVAAELRLVETLGQFQAVERLSRLAGQPIAPQAPVSREVQLPKAA